MAGEKLVLKAIEAARKSRAPEELLMGIHNTGAGRKLDMIEKLGGLPAPSIAVTKPSQGYTSFGDISLVAPVEMVTPGRKTPAFGSDVYSPRFPSVEDDQIFRGFTPSGRRRYAPVTMENVLREMKGPIRGGENFNYGPASVRAQVTPQFGSLPEMQAAREKIIPASEFGAQKEISNEMMERLQERFEPYFKPTDPYRQSWSAFPEVLTDYARTRNPSEFAYDYKDLPAEALTEARSFLGHLRDMPTEYFEVKPQRGVPLSEFAGAVVPGDVPGEVVDRLRRMGINRIEEYGDDASRRDALMKFVGEQGFADGGAVDFNDAPNYALDAETAQFNMGDVFAPRTRSLSQGKIPTRAEPMPLPRPVAPPEASVVDRALDAVRAQPRPLTISARPRMAAPPPPPRPVPRPAPAPAPAPAMPDASEARRLWDIYNETGNPADFVRASNAMRDGRAEGGEVREHHADGGKIVRKALEAVRYIRPRSPEQSAEDVAMLLRGAREKEVTDSLLEQADPRALFELYAAGRTGADMPMDYANRMQRAADLGFDKLIYRGTQGREALNRSLQTNRLEEGSKTFGTGSWASSDPDVAGTYSGLSEFSPVTMPLMVRSSALREVPWEGGLWSQGPSDQTTDRVARAAREEGVKGLTFSNITDIGPHLWNRADTQKRLPETSDTTVVFDPSIVRSPFARFDPRLENLTDLNRQDGGRVDNITPALDVARRASGGRLLEDEYPTQYLPNVGRQVMADGGEPTAQSRRRATLEQLGSFEDRPPMDPAVMGQNWASAVQRFRDRPLREGEATVRPLELGARDVIGGAIAGDGGITRGRLADIAVGSRGLPGSGTLGFGVADVTRAGIPLAISDFSDALRNEDYLSAGLSAVLPAAYYARKPIMAAGRAVYDAGARAVDTARDVLGRVPAPVAAGAAGAAAMTPEEAEAGKLDAARRGLQAARGIGAYHSSPHDFDRFDLSKIGTGEGAQRYGRGLYFAEAEPVAKGYREQLSSGTYKTPSGEVFDPFTLEHMNVRNAGYKSIDDAIERAFGLLQTQPQNNDLIARDLNRLMNMKEAGAVPNQGHMYEVNIKADPRQLVDWDRPVAEQFVSRMPMMKDLRRDVGPQEFDRMTFGGAYDTLGSGGEFEEAARKAGIPGIRYLDRASRGAGEGSRNYVVFDDKLIDILRKYAKGGVAKEIGSSPRETVES